MEREEEMNIYKAALLSTALLIAIPLSSQTTRLSGAPAAPGQQAQPQAVPAAKQHDGAKVFAANCSRCHQAPESFSPHVSGTIVRHMRVRAGLSKEDEEALLRFLNP